VQRGASVISDVVVTGSLLVFIALGLLQNSFGLVRTMASESWWWSIFLVRALVAVFHPRRKLFRLVLVVSGLGLRLLVV
jgi:hypothetical protein